jgi:hypothetical protein
MVYGEIAARLLKLLLKMNLITDPCHDVHPEMNCMCFQMPCKLTKLMGKSRHRSLTLRSLESLIFMQAVTGTLKNHVRTSLQGPSRSSAKGTRFPKSITTRWLNTAALNQAQNEL